jgi:glutaredoxin
MTMLAIIALNVLAIVLLSNRLSPEQKQEIVLEPQQLIRDQEPVRTLVLGASCPDCFDIMEYVYALNDTILMDVEKVPAADVPLFGTERLPAIAFNESFASYAELAQGWEQVGKIITITGKYEGTWYVLPTQNPPYIDTAANQVRGRVAVTYITKSDCSQCYDITITKDFLASSRINPYRESTVDASSDAGRAMIERYNITNVPTIILDDEAKYYENLQLGWSIVGSIESDGSYVLRDLQRLNVTYYDLGRNQVMTP